MIHRGANRLALFNGELAGAQLPRRDRPGAVPDADRHVPAIVDMQQNPWWRPPDSDWAKGLKPIPPGPGTRSARAGWGSRRRGVGIHGTPDAASIGYSASHGCIRMLIPEATWLFDHVRTRDAGPDRQLAESHSSRHLPGGLRPADGLGDRSRSWSGSRSSSAKRRSGSGSRAGCGRGSGRRRSSTRRVSR